MSYQSDMRILNQLLNKFEASPSEGVGKTIRTHVASMLRTYPEADAVIRGTYYARVLDAISYRIKVRARDFADAADQKLTQKKKSEARRKLLFEAETAMLRIKNTLPYFAKEAGDITDFHLTLAVRAHADKGKHKMKVSRKALAEFLKLIAATFKVTLSKQIRENIVASFNQGGPLADDLEPGGEWPELSDHYVKTDPGKRGKGRKSFGRRYGGMFRNIWREGSGSAIKIHYGKDRELGASELSVDFARTTAGRKLAAFYFGHSGRRGTQPPRHFTFLTQKSLAGFNRLVKKHFDDYVKTNFSIWVGTMIGDLPGPGTDPEFRMAEVWSRTGLTKK